MTVPPNTTHIADQVPFCKSTPSTAKTRHLVLLLTPYPLLLAYRTIHADPLPWHEAGSVLGAGVLAISTVLPTLSISHSSDCL